MLYNVFRSLFYEANFASAMKEGFDLRQEVWSVFVVLVHLNVKLAAVPNWNVLLLMRTVWGVLKKCLKYCEMCPRSGKIFLYFPHHITWGLGLVHIKTISQPFVYFCTPQNTVTQVAELIIGFYLHHSRSPIRESFYLSVLAGICKTVDIVLMGSVD